MSYMDILICQLKIRFSCGKKRSYKKKHGFCVAELILNERIYKTRNPWSQSFNILILHITGQTDTGPYFHIP